jgi:hypothetical protein
VLVLDRDLAPLAVSDAERAAIVERAARSA